MKNADMPAMPQTGVECASGDLNSSADWGGSGLTKREHFAAMAMQGMLASDEYAGSPYSLVAKESVLHADALLEQLSE